MKVSIVTPVLPPYAGGIGNVALWHAKSLLPLGYEVEVFTPDYGKEKGQHPFKVSYLPPKLKYGNAAYVPSLFKALKGSNFVELHYPFYGGAEVVKKFKQKNPNIPLIIYYHHDVFDAGWKGIYFNWHRRFVMPGIIKAADAVIVTSKDYAQESYIADLMQQEPNRFFEVPNGVDISLFKPMTDTSQIRQEYNINLDDNVILFVGGLDQAHYFKGVYYLLQAFNLIISQTQRRDIKLVIVGEGGLMPQFKNQVAQYGIDQDVIFTGRATAEELAKWYNAATVTVLPSTDKTEAFGMVLAESLACGTPAIASNLPGVRSVVDNNKNGYIVEPRDYETIASRCLDIINNQELAATFGQHGLKKVQEQYDWNQVIRQVTKVFHYANENLRHQ